MVDSILNRTFKIKKVTQNIYDLVFLVSTSRKLQLSSIVRILFLCPVPNQLQSRGVSPARYRDPLTGPIPLAVHLGDCVFLGDYLQTAQTWANAGVVLSVEFVSPLQVTHLPPVWDLLLPLA